MALFLYTSGSSLGQLIVVLISFVVILILTYYTTRWVAGYQKSKTFTQNLSIQETLRLPNNKYIQLIKAGEDTFYVIGIGKDTVTHLGTLSKDDLKTISESEANDVPTPKGDFKEILDRFKQGMGRK